MAGPKIICVLLVLFITKRISAENVHSDAFTLTKCLDISSNLADSLQRYLLGLKTGIEETPSKTPVVKDCLDLLRTGVKKSGVYSIVPDGKKIQVYCDMKTDGGGWTVFQRRVNAIVDFYRGWKDYKAGFGDLEGSFWLGLENIHKLSSLSTNSSSLRVDMWIPGEYRYETYSIFQVGNETSGYKLSVSKPSGTAGDSLSSNNKFTTYDKDQDTWSGNCAKRYKGAWWYDQCHVANINGLYLNGPSKQSGVGINWKAWKGYLYSIQRVEMKVRRNI